MSRLPTHPVEAVVDGFTHGGEGVARVDGKAVFVPGALPDETVRLRVVDDRKSWARGELLAVLEASPDRVEPPCPYVPACGGCDLQHVSPDGQLALKTRVVVEQLERLGQLEDPPVADAVAVGPALGYRTVARLHADDAGRLGYHREGTHDVVPVDVCPILTEGTQAVRSAVGDDTGAAEVTVRATATGDRAAVLRPGPGPLHLPTIDAVDGRPLGLQFAQPDGTTVTARGDGTVTEQIAGLDFTADVDGFFQTQTDGAEALVAAVLEVLGDVTGLVAWDLYAGVGLFSLPLARAGARVTAVEGVRQAVDHLDANAERAGLDDHVAAAAMDVREFVGRDHDAPPDVVVLDPPRTGAGQGLIADLAGQAPGDIVYVACDPAALARDARVLAEHGYRLRTARPFDLFPMTHHVEVVAHFRP